MTEQQRYGTSKISPADPGQPGRKPLSRSLRRWIGRPFLGLNERLWCRLPEFVRTSRLGHYYGRFLYSLVLLRSQRRQYHGTFFFRNRPELRLLCSLASRQPKGSRLRVAVLACSNGAEAYSMMFALRSVRPDLKIAFHAVDISSEVVEIARRGVYPRESQKLIGSAIFERITDDEERRMFQVDDGSVRVQEWVREGIEWHVGDAGDPALRAQLGPMDIVVANKFLCHMDAPDAERCLRAFAPLVCPGGYLFVSGVDLEVRTRVAGDLNWTPVRELLEEIHDGDASVRRDWPWRYWGLEPFDRSRKDWRMRYASVFQLGSAAVTQDPGELVPSSDVASALG